jgi:hypothetical protein
MLLHIPAALNCFRNKFKKRRLLTIKADYRGLDASASLGWLPGVRRLPDAPSDALGVVSRRGDGGGIPGLSPVSAENSHRTGRRLGLRHRRVLSEGGIDAAAGFGHILPKWRSTPQIPNSHPPHPQFRYPASFFH